MTSVEQRECDDCDHVDNNGDDHHDDSDDHDYDYDINDNTDYRYVD